MAASAGQPIATRAQGFINSLVGRISGYNPFPAATGGAVPQTISIDGMFNKWSGIGLGAWLYGMLPVNNFHKIKAKRLANLTYRRRFRRLVLQPVNPHILLISSSPALTVTSSEVLILDLRI